MPFLADLHLHSRHAYATSRDLDLEHLSLSAQQKGLAVVATGDFTHPAWWSELEAKLVPAEPGLFRLRPAVEREVAARLAPRLRRPTRFLLEVEISTVYRRGGATRRVHHLVYAGSWSTAAGFRERLGARGNLASDGRPILGIDSRELLEIVLESGPDAFLVPAHVWTPWYAVLGSRSGFDSIEACYGDLAGEIFAIETGLSSDPPMNWRVSALDRFTLVSSSDAHSPATLGREANVFDCAMDYFAIRRALETQEGWGGTVELFPEEGKYHADGHRACAVRLDPAETRRHEGLCPGCGKPVTVGVLHRVGALADRPDDEEPAHRAPFTRLVPLAEVVAAIEGVGPRTKTVGRRLDELRNDLGPELEILRTTPLEALDRVHPLLAEGIDRLRAGAVRVSPGYDGVYGRIHLFEPDELPRPRRGRPRRPRT